VGSLARPIGGWLADRLGGARVTFWNFVAMGAGVLGVLAALDSGSFPLFLGAFLVLFVTSGIGNGSTYRMIPAIFRAQAGVTGEGLAAARRQAAAVIGLASAVGAFGGFFIPRAFGASIARTGSIDTALAAFLVGYGLCLALTWWCYLRRSVLVARVPSLAHARV
jgi:MFS transporter, NNP family, nitrate/nitrite transporter